MANHISTGFQAELDGDVSAVVPYVLNEDSLNFEAQFPAAIAAGDTLVLGYIGGRYLLPELGSITSDGLATALTVSIGTGTFDAASETLTLTDADDIMLSKVVSAAAYSGLVHTAALPAGVGTRIEPIDTNVIVVTASAETSGELATLYVNIPFSKNPLA